MPRSRTIKTLFALLGALTLGTFTLLALETSPARPGPAPILAATSSSEEYRLSEIFPKDRPLDTRKWQHIVIHDSVCEGTGNAEDGCHFVISAINSSNASQMIRGTGLWQRQLDGAHVYLRGHNFNANSIGICIIGDTAQQAPAPEQMRALIALVRALQWQCRIRSEHVYLHGNLTGASCPAGRFPAEQFRSHLLTF